MSQRPARAPSPGRRPARPGLTPTCGTSGRRESSARVMDPDPVRSPDVTATTATVPATATEAFDFDALYREARDDVFAYAATFLRDRAAAEDVTAQAFERAYQKRSSRYDARRGSPRAWLFGIARNAALDELRRR